MPKKTKKAKAVKNPNPFLALAEHIAGLKAGVDECKPTPTSPAGRVSLLLGEAMMVIYQTEYEIQKSISEEAKK